MAPWISWFLSIRHVAFVSFFVRGLVCAGAPAVSVCCGESTSILDCPKLIRHPSQDQCRSGRMEEAELQDTIMGS